VKELEVAHGWMGKNTQDSQGITGRYQRKYRQQAETLPNTHIAAKESILS